MDSSINHELRARLLAMEQEDATVRAELAATGELFQGYAPRMADVHNRNARSLESIITEHGWPGRTLVGEDGAHAAWRIVQHAIGLPEFQRRCLPILRTAAEASDIDPAFPAFLEDRICFFERRPQRFGTQFDWDEQGQMSPWTLADPEHVDELRRSVGLGPLAERIAELRQQAEDAAPADTERRQREMLEWARSVGWL
jgi:hypothetical protein